MNPGFGYVSPRFGAGFQALMHRRSQRRPRSRFCGIAINLYSFPAQKGGKRKPGEEKERCSHTILMERALANSKLP